MKNKKILRVLIPSVVVLALAIGFIAFGAGRSGSLTPDAARRPDGVPADGVVIIDPNLTALAGELSGTAESKAAAKAALDEINSTRSAAGLGTLSWSNGLEQASSVRAVEAAQVWSHTRPDGSEYWTVNSNLVYGENLAKGYDSASGAFSAWMASPSHKDNILFGDFRTAAIAVHIDPNSGQWYWANEFGY
ncbi:MAG: CAP domain-containing protein [Lachnospiraceae bacterium]|nr:CAP domain-containing protein [Lachnospiraceae bacterium]